MNYLLLFLFAFGVSAQVIELSYEEKVGKDPNIMTFSPEGFISKRETFDILYSRKDDKIFLIINDKSYELATSSASTPVVKSGFNGEGECEEYIEDNTTDHLALVCTAKIDQKVIDYINGRYSIAEYFKVYYERLAGLTYPAHGKEAFPKLMQMLKRNTQEVIQSEKFLGLRTLKVNEVKYIFNKYKTPSDQCENIRECFSLAYK